MPDEHGEHEGLLPDETTPQGTQEDGVPFGHEGLDINLRQVVSWFIGTALATGIIQLILLGGYSAWENYARAQAPLPSPLWGTRQVPPEPRLEPDPAAAITPNANQPIRLGPEVLHDFRAQESAQLQHLGLENPTTLAPEIPPNIAASVSASGAGPLPAGGPMGTDTVNPGPNGAGGPMAGAVSAPFTGKPGTTPISSQDALTRPMPSESSGGTTLENELK